MLATTGLLLLVILLTTLLLTWRWRHFSYFKRLGIPGPRPNLLWGNLMEYHSTDLYKVIGRWIEKYGDIYGFYNGDVPFVVTTDLDLIEKVCVRNFKNFMNRGVTMATMQQHPYLGRSVLHVPAPYWKNIRSSVATIFSPVKLKQMMPSLEKDVNIYLSSLEQYAETGEEVHMLRMYEPFAMDLTGRRCFGIPEQIQDNPDHPTLGLAKYTANDGMTGALHMVGQCVGSLGPFMKPLCFLSLLPVRFHFRKMEVQKRIETRLKDPSSRKPDILQHLIEAKYVERESANGAKQEENGVSKSRPLTTDEVIISAGTLCLAGFETMASSLSYVTFTLAQHPDVQEKVREEVRDAVREQGTLDYDTVMKKLNYLEQVMNETLRLYPPGLTFVTREAKEDFQYKELKFKAGTCFMVPLYQIMRDARFWPEPLEFRPERFSPENEDKLNKRAFLAFGIGPRNCLGMKIAVLYLKFTIAKLVQKYCFQLGPSQKGEMTLASHAMVSEPSEGPWVILRHAKP
ncbi:cytochrome P450 3A14-like [Amblyomma americanum]